MSQNQLISLSALVNIPIGICSVVIVKAAPQPTPLLTAEMGVIIYLLVSITMMITIFLAVGTND